MVRVLRERESTCLYCFCSLISRPVLYAKVNDASYLLSSLAFPPAYSPQVLAFLHPCFLFVYHPLFLLLSFSVTLSSALYLSLFHLASSSYPNVSYLLTLSSPSSPRPHGRVSITFVPSSSSLPFPLLSLPPSHPVRSSASPPHLRRLSRSFPRGSDGRPGCD